MKRLFGLIGITYLATLTAVFYFESPAFIAAAITAAALGALGIYKRFRSDRYMFKTFLTAGVSVALALVSIFLYQNYYISPIVNNYSDKEISAEGYLCEEKTVKENSVEYLIQTTAINGKPVRAKIRYIGKSETDVNEFDCVELNVKVRAETSSKNIGHRVFLCAVESSPDCIKATGESRFSPYKYAIWARKAMRKAIGRLMTHDSASISRAVLLGDKYALSGSVRDSFTKTGTSYLIVVSGLHLSVALALVTGIINKFTRRRIPLCIGSIAVIICFSALTGFNYSVLRAAIAVIIYQIGRIILRNSDPLNSLGFAALAITITNPCAVGDLGLIMSFSATMGIILWADKIVLYTTKPLKKHRLPKRINKAAYFIINAAAVSVSASLWIMPISVIAFGRISPLVVLISFFTEPIASLILVLSLVCAVTYLFQLTPVITYLLAYIDDLMCRLIIVINDFFAKQPVTFIRINGRIIYIWLAAAAILVIIGCAIKAKKKYAVISINIMFSLTLILTAFSYLTADASSRIRVYRSGGEIGVEVRKENNISLLCAGGRRSNAKRINEDIIDCGGEIDNLIIPNADNYSSLLPEISDDFNIINLITGEGSADLVGFSASKEPFVIGDGTIQRIRLNASAEVTVIGAGGAVYQYIENEGSAVLLIPRRANIDKLPEEYRCADRVILDGIPKNIGLIDCDDLIYTGASNSFYTEKLEELRSQGKSITVLTGDGETEI